MKKIIKAFKRFILEQQIKKCETKRMKVKDKMDVIHYLIMKEIANGKEKGSKVEFLKVKRNSLYDNNIEMINRISDLKIKIIRLAY